MANFKDDVKLQSIFASNRKKCSCGHSVEMLYAGKREYIVCTWCGKKVFKDDEKQRIQDNKIKMEEFRMRLRDTVNKYEKEITC